MGSRYAEIEGPKHKQKTHWWVGHPWYCYLQEIGMAEYTGGSCWSAAL
ncbi:hypothetical protein AB0M45_21820 [Nocardia sp. NPDC051787]